MKTMDTKEMTLLGKDLKIAKALVLKKHGFSCTEIAAAMDIPESVVRKLVETAESSEA